MWSPDLSAPSSPPAPASSSSLSRSAANARRRLSAHSLGLLGLSPTPNFGSLVGSYEESLLRGRMSMPASKPLTFDAELGVLGLGKCNPALRCPPHLNLKFPAHFYDLKASSGSPERDASSAIGSPYVGTIDLETHYFDQALAHQLDKLDLSPPPAPDPYLPPAFPGYRVPPKGQIQLVIKNPNLTAVKLFLVPYDLTDMPAGSKTFIRQKSLITPPSPGSEAIRSLAPDPDGSPCSARSIKAPARDTLRYAIHLQFCSLPQSPRRSSAGKAAAAAAAPKVYLHKTIRVVFAARTPDKSEKLSVVTETPGFGEQRYTSFAGPCDEWKRLRLHGRGKRGARRNESASATGTGTGTGAGTGLGIAIEPRTFAPNSDPDGERWVEKMQLPLPPPAPAPAPPSRPWSPSTSASASNSTGTGTSTSTAADDDDRALLDAWHHTWRRQPQASLHSYRSASRPDSPVSPCAAAAAEPHTPGAATPASSSASMGKSGSSEAMR